MLRVCSTFVLLVAAAAAQADLTGRVDVIDGDTWLVGGQKVRLFGIDAPELDQTCVDAAGVDRTCGQWVRRQVSQRFEGRQARCEVLDQDRYGRLVARCFVGRRDAAREIVDQGWARAYRRYSMDYDLDEKRAFVAGRGIHAWQMQRPAEYRAAKRKAPAVTGKCKIKGNISGSGRIYHMPGQADYERTVISAKKGERMFCTEAEAQAAGWRRARR